MIRELTLRAYAEYADIMEPASWRGLSQALRDALASDVVKTQLGNDGTEITPGRPEDYADFIDKDEKKWSQLVKASGVEQE